MTEVREVYRANNIVGESAVWDDRTQRLLWVDIVGKRISRLDPRTGHVEFWNTDEFVTSIGLCDDNRAIVGLRRNVALWSFGDEFETLALVEPGRPENRLNEGRVGPDGAYWVGTMVDNLNDDGTPKDGAPTGGAVYRVLPSGHVEQLTDNSFGVTNTFAWTLDRRLLVADSAANTIYSYALDRPSGERLEIRTTFSPFNRGVPDGSCLDAEGYLWNCRVAGGACVVRHTPAGTIDRVIELPCSWPTSCTFGGSDFGTLYVTSARITMTAEHLAANPHEGSVFAVETGFRGTPEHRFRTT